MGQCDQLVFFPAEDPFGLRKYKAYYRKGGRLLYCVRRDESSTVEGLHSVYIQDYFPRMLVRRALQQLDEYLETNWANTEMYQYDAFWKDALYYAGRPVIPKEVYVLDTRVDEGHVYIYAGDSFTKECVCCYDLIREKLYLRYTSWRRENEIPPQDFADYLFDGKQQQILAQCQLDEGVMPQPYRDAYLEIARINGFLKGKRTVRAWFGSRAKGVLCYPREVQTAAFLIRLENARFENFSYNYRHDEEGNAVRKLELAQAGLPRKLTHHSEELSLHPELLCALTLIPADPKVREKLEQEARAADRERRISESGGGLFYEITFLADGYEAGHLLDTGNRWLPEVFLTRQPTRDQMLELYAKYAGRMEVKIVKHCIGDSGAQPVPEDLLETIRGMPPARWKEMQGYQQDHQVICLGSDAIFQLLGACPEISDTKRKRLRMARFRFLATSADTQYLFTLLELEGSRAAEAAVISGHPREEAEICRLDCVQRFIAGHPGEEALTIWPHYLTAGEGESAPLPDEWIELIAGSEPMEILEERAFHIVHPEQEEIRCDIRKWQNQNVKGQKDDEKDQAEQKALWPHEGDT